MATWPTPHDRLTQIANDLGAALEDHPLFKEGDKVIVLVNDEHRGGIGVMGYEEHRDALVDMFIHMRNLAEAFGVNLDIMFPEHN